MTSFTLVKYLGIPSKHCNCRMAHYDTVGIRSARRCTVLSRCDLKSRKRLPTRKEKSNSVRPKATELCVSLFVIAQFLHKILHWDQCPISCSVAPSNHSRKIYQNHRVCVQSSDCSDYMLVYFPKFFWRTTLLEKLRHNLFLGSKQYAILCVQTYARSSMVHRLESILHLVMHL